MSAELLHTTTTELLNILGLSYDKVEVAQGHRTVVNITTTEPHYLIGPHEEYLQALNTLIRRLIEEKTAAQGTFLIDVNNHQDQKLDGVRVRARLLAQRVRLLRRDVAMEPTSAYERLVLHELFEHDPQIETRSEGEGPARHIVFSFKNPQGGQKKASSLKA